MPTAKAAESALRQNRVYQPNLPSQSFRGRSHPLRDKCYSGFRPVPLRLTLTFMSLGFAHGCRQSLVSYDFRWILSPARLQSPPRWTRRILSYQIKSEAQALPNCSRFARRRLLIDCNDSTVAVALWAMRTLPVGKRLQEA